jgi:hypothetical protein
MSTKHTLAFGDKFHFYRETLDDDHVYLKISGSNFKATPRSAMLQIPAPIWETIRHLGAPDLGLAEKSDEELLAYVESVVDRRIDQLRKVIPLSPARANFVLIAGAMIYGRADQPRDTQIARGLNYYQRERERQKRVKTAILQLRRLNGGNDG